MTKTSPEGQTVFAKSFKTLAKTVMDPLFLYGGGTGILGGWLICWCLFVLPFQSNLKERETQLEKWSQLNQDMQVITMENRELSQTELKKFVAMNQEAATQFMEVQRLLHDRELRLTTTPAYFIIIPICVMIATIALVAMFLKTLNSRALATVDHVIHMAPKEMVQEIVARHIATQSMQIGRVLPAPGPDTVDAGD